MRIPTFPLFALVSTVLAHPDDTLLHARRAQALLGMDVWSQVIRIENTARTSRYPRTLHALVFETVGALWFYTSLEGTQSLSLYRNHVAEDKADLTPLLRAIDAGFTRWRAVEPDAGGSRPAPAGALPNGCFIESLARLRQQTAFGVRVQNPRLLSYYLTGAEGLHGHTVLAYDAGEVTRVFDPSRPTIPFAFSKTVAEEPLQLARELEVLQAARVVRAQTLPLSAQTAGSYAVVAGRPEKPGT